MEAKDLYANLNEDSVKQLKELAREIKKKYEVGPRKGEPQGRVILFLGAAVNYHAPEGFEQAYSKEERPPIGWELNEALVNEIFAENGDPERESDMLNEHLSLSYVSQYFEESQDRLRLIETLGKQVDKEKPSPLLNALAEMDFKYIISTNYDHLFENALVKAGKADYYKGIYKANRTGTPQPTLNIPDKNITVEKPFLYKFHGDIRDVFDEEGIYQQGKDSIVLTDEDYLHFILRMSQVNDNKEKSKEAEQLDMYPIPQVINEAFAGKNQNTFLFVGYGLQDYNLRLIFKTALWAKDNNTFSALQKWSISLNKHRPIQEFWIRNHKITFIEHNVWSAIPFLYKEIFGKEIPLT